MCYQLMKVSQLHILLVHHALAGAVEDWDYTQMKESVC